MGIRTKIRRFRDYMSEDIWNENVSNLSKARARLVKDLRVLIITVKTFSAQKIGFQAVALSFFCTMAAVPFIAIAIAITGGIGLDGTLKQVISTYITNPQAVDTLFGFVDNIINTAKSSTLGLLSALLFCWLVIWMMMCAESVFNNVWKVNKSRKIMKRLSFYLLILLLAPFIVLLFFTGSVVYSNLLDILVPSSIAFSAGIKSFLGWVIFAAVSVLTFSAMYKFIPNFPVAYRNAIKAAVFSGPAFTLIQYLFLETQIFVTRLNAIYGAVAAIPLFMFWLNFGWFIILIGAELSYAFQNVNSYNIETE
ncbi:MAG: YihY/virulence factor BrkB family protein [Candidatus Cryptobacteroides sp.]